MSGAARLLWIEMMNQIEIFKSEECQEPQGSCGLKSLLSVQDTEQQQVRSRKALVD